MLKNKRVLLVVGAIVFIVLLFFLKTKSEFKNEALEQQGGLSYGNIKVEELLNKDTDGDGVLDWEEGLWGTDSTNKDTDGDGVGDNIEVAQMKPAGAENEGSGATIEEENLTQTDKFSRELFATVAALNQTGEIDQSTVDTLSTSLIDQIKNYPVRKVFVMSEMKVTTDNSTQAYQNYNNALNNIYKKYPTEGNAIEVLREFVGDGENLSIAALSKLDPIIKQTKGFMDEMVKTNVPSDLAQLHLDMINALERLMENLGDLQLFESDVIVSMGAISKYEENADLLQTTMGRLTNAIMQKLNT